MTALPPITVRLDDRAVAMPAGATLAQLLALERREAAAVATALNGRFVPRVLFFQPIVGG